MRKNIKNRIGRRWAKPAAHISVRWGWCFQLHDQRVQASRDSLFGVAGRMSIRRDGAGGHELLDGLMVGSSSAPSLGMEFVSARCKDSMVPSWRSPHGQGRWARAYRAQ